VTRQRLYIDTMENVLSRANKVVIDQKAGGGNGNMIYLPLDKLTTRPATPPASSGESQADAAFRAQTEVESVTVDGRQRGER
jgi:membrane protease subunit HflK